MFARFRLANGSEININTANVKCFEPAADPASSKITFTDNTSVEVPFSNQSLRSAFKPKADKPEVATAAGT